MQRSQRQMQYLTSYRYEDKYHQFFPIANPAAMDFQNLHTIAAKEPHLLAAILTVASKDQPVGIRPIQLTRHLLTRNAFIIGLVADP